VVCSNLDAPDLVVTLLRKDCNFCESEAADLYIAEGEDHSSICIPRGVCISECGPEEPGCVYTGSCQSQICFESALSEKKAEFRRITHSGARSSFTVDHSGPDDTEPNLELFIAEPGAVFQQYVESRIDRCPALAFVLPFRRVLCLNPGLSPLGALQSTPFEPVVAQCRNVCASFDYTNYEVVVIPTECGFCNKEDAQEFIEEFEEGSREICVPHDRCDSECGTAYPGCVYSGSCESLICYSGIDSRKAATFPTLTDSGVQTTISVNNSGMPSSIDLPVFVAMGVSATTSPSGPDGDGTPASEPSEPDSPDAADAGAGDSDDPASTSSNPEVTDPVPGNGSTSMWVWLSPLVVAVVAGILFVVLGIVSLRRGGQFLFCYSWISREKSEGDTHPEDNTEDKQIPSVLPCDNEKYSIFISHAGPDKKTFAVPLHRRIVEKLEELRLDVGVFLDKEELRLGDDAPEKMIRAMNESKIGIFVLSPEFASRKWTMKELACFIDRRTGGKEGKNIPILVPVFLRLSVANCRDRELHLRHFENENGEDIFRKEGFQRWSSMKVEDVHDYLSRLSAFTGEESQTGDTEEERAAAIEKIASRVVELYVKSRTESNPARHN